MKLKNILKIMALLIPLPAVLLEACSAAGCYENHSAIPLAQFYSEESGTQISINNINVGGVGAPNDSLLISSGTAASEVYLPFRYNREELTFFIDYVGENETVAARDEITFRYKAIPYFAGEACGALYNYKLEEVNHTSDLLARVEIIDSLITNIDRSYMRFYFKTSTGEDPDPEQPEE